MSSDSSDKTEKTRKKILEILLGIILLCLFCIAIGSFVRVIIDSFDDYLGITVYLWDSFFSPASIQFYIDYLQWLGVSFGLGFCTICAILCVLFGFSELKKELGAD